MPAFKDLVSNPLEGQPAEKIFGELSTTLVFFINLTYIFLYAALMVMVAYNIMKLSQKLIFSDYEETYQKFKDGLTNAVFCIVGIFFIISIRALFTLILSTVGITNADSIFYNLPF